MEIYAPLIFASGLLYYGYKRVERAEGIITKRTESKERAPEPSVKRVPRYPYVSARDRIMDPTVWRVNEPGYARTGQYGLERRDYPDIGGTRVVTYGDHWVNV
jgi:hypothetical protein